MKAKTVTAKMAALGLSVALGASAFGLAGCGSPAGSAGESQSSQEAPQSDTVATYADIENMDLDFTERDMNASYDASKATKISLDGATGNVDGTGASFEGSTVTISEEGTYTVTGSLEGQLVVDTTSKSKVQVVLAGASVKNQSGPAMYIKQADKCFVTLAEGTENVLADGEKYSETDEDGPNAALYSKDDLTINGTGTLTVSGSYKHGINSKDDLVVTGGTLNVNAAKDALRGKDSLKIAEGTFNLEAGEDAVKSSRDDDPAKGYVLIAGGTFSISAGDDAIHGETALFVNDGGVNVAKCNEGLEAMVLTINGGEVNVVSSDDALNASAPSSNSSKQEAGSRQHEGFNSKNANVNGDANSSSDESPAGAEPGNPADSGSTSNGSNGAQPPEGFKHRHDSSDLDGNPKQRDGFERNGGGAMDDANENCKLIINGGTVTLEAKGDAIDSNGTVEINGGTVLVTGPISNYNSAFDYGISATINGGTVLMVGSIGMAQDFNSGTQPFAFAQASGQAGQKVTIASLDGTEIISYTPTADFSVVQTSSPQFTEGGTYKLVIGETSMDITASTQSSGPSEQGSMMGHGHKNDGFNGKGANQPEGSSPGAEGPANASPQGATETITA